ncbi:MAG TPA: fumarylacetoacetate hydrolase family protein [Candidatus Dormibacteraeota bacterium]|jgi:2-keto-4-pentenoate hydratase/2-oxohepta-3-ene-1,7-dioic acid hydratase in catechol pathway|nr:fumarylacetoacetate hydrolase family protein [Candidatus Dormibacteraeota bacterium]
MRLVTFRADGSDRLGVLRNGDQVAEIADLTMEGLIALAPEARSFSTARSRRLQDVTLMPPLLHPRGNVIAIGRNYQKHAEETAKIDAREPSPPTVFTKAITSLTGPFDDIAIDPSISDRIDWEVELAVVIGRRGANIPRSEALSYVFGYTVINDVSARDIQMGWGGQYFKGKSLDASSPIGPWIVTSDEIPDPQALTLRLRVNGETKQDGTTADMIFPVDALIEWVSKGMTLLPGSIIATGTPDGVGFARTPPEFLKPGDVMETEVEGIGVMRNRIVAAGRD